MTAEHTESALVISAIVIPQGATESATWPPAWEYAEGDPLGIPAGWPGSWTGRMEIRDHRGDGSTVLATLHSADPADGVVLLETTTDAGTTYARVTLQIPAATSTAWTWQDGEEPAVFDLEVADGTRTIRLAEGTVALSGEVTTVA